MIKNLDLSQDVYSKSFDAKPVMDTEKIGNNIRMSTTGVVISGGL